MRSFTTLSALPPSLLCLAMLGQTLSPVAHADQVDDWVKREMARQHIPGLALAVVKNGKVVKQKGYGWANLEHKVSVTPDTVFQSGSIGKQFTAAMVQLLEADGKLGFDDLISKHLPDTPKAWEKITIRHLLTHTSGLADPYQKLDFRKDYTDAELIKLEGEIPLLFEPGEKFSYSNMGYHVLGFLCNRVGGRFYGDQMVERLFAPLGMQTRIINERNLVPHRAAGYDWHKGEWKNQEWVSPGLNTTADGSLYLTIQDLVRWNAALNQDKPLTAAQRKAAITPAKLNNGSSVPYGFGWQLAPQNGRQRISHNGAWQGFTSYIGRFPDDKLSVMLLTNLSGVRIDKIGIGIAALYQPELAQRPAKPIDDTEPAVTLQIRTLFQQMADGTIQPEPFSAWLIERLFPELIKELGADLKQLGPMTGLALLSRSVEGEKRLYRYRASYRSQAHLVDVSFDKAGKIDRLNYNPE